MSETDPNRPNVGALRFGSPFSGKDNRVSQRWCRGTISGVYPHTYTCDVNLEGGEILTGVPFPDLQQDPAGPGGEVTVPHEGQQVIVQLGLGFPVITSKLPHFVDSQTDQTDTHQVSEASSPSAFPETSGPNFRGRLPKDLLPGDWLKMGSLGQFFSLLAGGAVAMHASPWARVRALQFDDTLQLYGRNLEIFTGFGDIKFKDENGKQSFELKAGTDQKTETGLGQENWTVRIGIGGSNGEGLFNFALIDKKGEPFYQRTVLNNGGERILNRGAYTHTIDGKLKQEIRNGRQVEVTSGSDELLVRTGDRKVDIAGSLQTIVRQNLRNQVLNDRSDSINRDCTFTVGRSFKLGVSGDPKSPPGTAAAKIDVNNGPFEINLGFPGAEIKQDAHFTMNCFTPGGKIEFNSFLGEFIVNTTKPGSVKLGALVGVAPFHATLFETLDLWMKALLTWLDNHIHLDPHTHLAFGVPTSPNVVTQKPVIPASTIVESLIPPIKSQNVLIGM